MDFLKHIRQDPADLRWSFVLSGHWFKHDDPSLVEAGATAQCPKPIAPSKLIRTLQEWGVALHDRRERGYVIATGKPVEVISSATLKWLRTRSNRSKRLSSAFDTKAPQGKASK